jgi:hypothetical protein
MKKVVGVAAGIEEQVLSFNTHVVTGHATASAFKNI